VSHGVGVQLLKLTDNYRSSSRILTVGHSFLSGCGDRRQEKQLVPTKVGFE
jgi:hypothetical protein